MLDWNRNSSYSRQFAQSEITFYNLKKNSEFRCNGRSMCTQTNLNIFNNEIYSSSLLLFLVNGKYWDPMASCNFELENININIDTF